MYVLETECMCWRLNVCVGDCMYVLETECMCWRLNVCVGD